MMKEVKTTLFTGSSPLVSSEPLITCLTWDFNFNLPSVAFNYLGQLTVDGVTGSANDEYIPLAQGAVFYPSDPNTKALQFSAPDASENPPGNSTSSMFNVIRIDHLTGRAVQLHQKVQ